jgi:hypothetical protein
LLEREPVGYKSNHRNFSIWTQGNGLWEYEPDLTSGGFRIEGGALSHSGLKANASGLTLVGEKGEVVFDFFSPYIIVPKVNDFADPDDDTQAVVVQLEAVDVPVAVRVSTDRGHTWSHVGEAKQGAAEFDLTRWVKGRYEYWLKLQAVGKPGKVAVKSMRVRTWVQVAPASLPRLEEGVNKCRYELGDRYGLATIPTVIQPNLADAEDLKKYVVEVPRNYAPKKISGRVRGDLVIKYEAPPGREIRWLTVGGAFTTYQGQRADRTDNRIEIAVGEPKKFREIYKADVPTWVNHWRYQWDQEVHLDEPAKAVYVKYTGKPAVNAVRATLHCDEMHRMRDAIEVTHGYKVDGQLIERKFTFNGPADYTVTCDGEPENTFVRMAVPSSAK